MPIKQPNKSWLTLPNNKTPILLSNWRTNNLVTLNTHWKNGWNCRSLIGTPIISESLIEETLMESCAMIRCATTTESCRSKRRRVSRSLAQNGNEGSFDKGGLHFFETLKYRPPLLWARSSILMFRNYEKSWRDGKNIQRLHIHYPIFIGYDSLSFFMHIQKILKMFLRYHRPFEKNAYNYYFPSLQLEINVCINNLNTSLRHVYGTKNGLFWNKLEVS